MLTSPRRTRAQNGLTPRVEGIVVLDADGKRIAVKYYPKAGGALKDNASQLALEEQMFKKCRSSVLRAEADVIVLDHYVAIHEAIADAFFFVLGADENELILLAVLNTLQETMATLLRNQVDRSTLINNLDLLMLAIDEIIDDGNILETDFALVANRVTMKGAQENVPLVEQSLTQALQTAKDQLFR